MHAARQSIRRIFSMTYQSGVVRSAFDCQGPAVNKLTNYPSSTIDIGRLRHKFQSIFENSFGH